MTDIEVLLNNIKVVIASASGTVLFIWGVYYFFRTIFSEGGRSPVRIVMSAGVIAIAAGIFAMIPSLISAGSDTGKQIGGGGGAYSGMPAPTAAITEHPPVGDPSLTA
jgi:hypothetical protein